MGASNSKKRHKLKVLPRHPTLQALDEEEAKRTKDSISTIELLRDIIFSDPYILFNLLDDCIEL